MSTWSASPFDGVVRQSELVLGERWPKQRCRASGSAG